MPFKFVRSLTIRCVAFIATAFLLCPGLMAADQQYTLRGQITDTSDNLLPDVRVALKRADVSTHTDGNGEFSLVVDGGRPLTKDKNNIIDFLEIDKDGYLGRTVNILDFIPFRSEFSSPVSWRRKSSRASHAWPYRQVCQ